MMEMLVSLMAVGVCLCAIFMAGMLAGTALEANFWQTHANVRRGMPVAYRGQLYYVVSVVEHEER